MEFMRSFGGGGEFIQVPLIGYGETCVVTSYPTELKKKH